MTTFASQETNRVYEVQEDATDITTPDLSLILDGLPTATANFTLLVGNPKDSTTWEWWYITSVNAGTNTVTIDNAAKRGLAMDCTYAQILANTAGASSRRKPVYSGYKAMIVTSHAELNDKASKTGDNTLSGANTFSGDVVFSKSAKVPVYADATARDAAITSPANGMLAYLTDTGVNTQYIAGAWVNVEAGGTFPNASTTVAGKVEIATQAETTAGTATGETGASLSATPATLAVTAQNAQWSYAADAEASDTYAITLTPAPTAYAAGQVFYFKANTANTGAATLNVNALGAKTIKKLHDQDLETGDIEAGSIICVSYDGTNLQMQTPTATDISTANKTTLTNGSNADALHIHTYSPDSASAAATTDTTRTAAGSYTFDIAVGATGFTKYHLYYRIHVKNQDPSPDRNTDVRGEVQGVLGDSLRRMSNSEEISNDTPNTVTYPVNPTFATTYPAASATVGGDIISVNVTNIAESSTNIRISYTVAITGSATTYSVVFYNLGLYVEK